MKSIGNQIPFFSSLSEYKTRTLLKPLILTASIPGPTVKGLRVAFSVRFGVPLPLAAEAAKRSARRLGGYSMKLILRV